MKVVSHSYDEGAAKRQQKLFHVIYRYTNVKWIKISKVISGHDNADEWPTDSKG